jgi:hypothetical protein
MVCVSNTDNLGLYVIHHSPEEVTCEPQPKGTEGHYVHNNVPLTLRRNAAGSKSVTATNTAVDHYEIHDSSIHSEL